MSPDRRVRLWLSLAACYFLALPVCSGGGGGGGGGPGMGQRQFRAIAGVSMGAYGALNLGTKHRDMFGMIGALGGPVDMRQLLIDIEDDNLEVKPQMGPIPMVVGDDFTFDLLPPYPDRGTRITFTKDLVLAFGNPTLHHPDPGMAYLASHSQPAQAGQRFDDVWGSFMIPADTRGFQDGGDANDDGLRQTTETTPDEFVDALLLADGTLASAFGESGTVVGGREVVDTNSDGIFDLGDGIVLNMSEPFTDTNMNGVRDGGEAFLDRGLDGVDDTRDFGEENGAFDEDPDIENWLDEDPLSRIRDDYSGDTMRSQRIYMDVGTEDELNFAVHYDNLVPVIESKGVTVVEDTLDGGSFSDCLQLPDIDDPYFLLRYEGNHIGFDEQGLRDDLEDFDLNVCNNVLIWQRLLHLLAAVDAAFPDGFDGPGGLDLDGEVETVGISSPALAVGGGAPPTRNVVVYTPPAFDNTDRSFPILYFMGGHGQSPEDYRAVGDLLDALILADEIQNMFVAFLPGEGGVEGSFYVNHTVSEAQVPDIPMNEVTSGRYGDSIIQDLIPHIEQVVLENRVR